MAHKLNTSIAIGHVFKNEVVKSRNIIILIAHTWKID
jgi:hypothetical protein